MTRDVTVFAHIRLRALAVFIYVRNEANISLGLFRLKLDWALHVRWVRNLRYFTLVPAEARNQTNVCVGGLVVDFHEGTLVLRQFSL